MLFVQCQNVSAWNSKQLNVILKREQFSTSDDKIVCLSYLNSGITTCSETKAGANSMMSILAQDWYTTKVLKIGI